MREASISRRIGSAETVMMPPKMAIGPALMLIFSASSGGRVAIHWDNGSAIGLHSCGVFSHQLWPVAIPTVA
jgi:hypothetical protein